MDSESELVYMSDVEFANTIQKLPRLTSQFRGKTVPNKHELIITEVIGSKYDNVFLDFKNCSPKERMQLRNEYTRIEKQMTTNSKNKRDSAFGLDGSRTFISSELYPTLLVVSPPKQSKTERYTLLFLY